MLERQVIKLTKVIIIALIIFAVIIIVNNLRGKKPEGGGTILNVFKNFLAGKNPESGRGNAPARKRDDKTVYLAPWIVCVLDPETGDIIREKDIVLSPENNEFRIGYSDKCDLVLDSETVGRVHLRIGRDDQGFFAMDNDSVNGTYIDGQPVSSFPLEERVVYVADAPIYFKKRQMVAKIEKPRFAEEKEEATKRKTGFTKINVMVNPKENNEEIPLKR